jgi:hypothetical protein
MVQDAAKIAHDAFARLQQQQGQVTVFERIVHGFHPAPGSASCPGPASMQSHARAH